MHVSSHILRNAILAITCLTTLYANAILPSEAVFAHESTDTTRINRLLAIAIEKRDPQARVAAVGRELIGTPYATGTLEGTPEQLKINLDSMDCTTYVETVMAIAYTAGEGRTSWRDYVYNLEKIRYRQGTINGYASRLHYISDWIVDNTHRGTLVEYTSRMPINDWAVKTLDFMSSHRDKYPALKDSAEYARIKNAEIGYRNHRFPYIKATRLGAKPIISALKEGDVVAITTKTPGLDVSHMGIIVKIDGAPYLMHASSKQGKVVIDSLNLAEYLRRNGGTGIRVIRLNE